MTTSSNPMVQTPVPTLFFQFAGHALISLLAITSASVIDGLFVGNLVGAGALAAVTLLVPWLTLLFALGLVLAIGGSVRAGHLLGQHRRDEASRLFGASVLAAALAVALAGMVITLWPGLLYQALNVPEALRPLVAEYLAVMKAALVLQIATMVAYYFVRADGHTGLATRALVVGACSNIVLNAVLVGGFKLGLAGAAWATLLAQLVQAGLMIQYLRRPGAMTLRFRGWPWRDLRAAVANGLSEGINEVSVGVMIWLVNWLMLRTQGAEGVAAFSIVNYLIFIGVMTCYGIVDGVHPLVSHNLGAGQTQRARQVVKLAAVTLGGLGLLMSALLLLAGHRIPALFLHADETEAMAQAAALIAIIWPLFLFNGFNMLIAVTFTALQRPLPSAIIAFSRSLVLPAGLMLWLAWTAPAQPFLLALPLAEALTLVLALGLAAQARSRARVNCA
ncbi:polysaccharide biosynthesis C-terminal domain-containing protein [Oceanimonas sp. NS1]|nr:polysaccharide biosynthesis C-terminal domain-containing protein [Oceanimonas sp. NS1]